MTFPRPYEIISYSQLEKPLEREKNMTRKDYQLIAEILKASGKCGVGPFTLESLAVSFAQELKKENPNFKPALFLKACGI